MASSLFIIITTTLSLLPTISLSDPRISESAFICGRSRTNSSTFVTNFTHDMESLSDLVASKTWGAHSSSSVYGLAHCHADLSLTDCLLCFSESRTKLPKCIPATSGIVFLDGCFLRYDSYNFYSESTNPKVDQAVCNTLERAGGLDNSDEDYSNKVGYLMGNLTKKAAEKGGSGWGNLKGEEVYGLVQCWNTLSMEGCRECLQVAWREVKKCLPWTEARGLNIGCYMRYSNRKFYSDGNEENGDKKNAGNSRMDIIIGVSSSLGIMVLLLSVLGVCLVFDRLKRKRQQRKHLYRLSSTVSRSNLNFKYETLEKATDFFDSSRKLGQGAAGSVYKGILPDGRLIAVKRLFFNTRQWVDEFFNEVNLVSGVEHENLVKLLGCSIEGPESLLVYEYVPNKSLDQYLFCKNKTQFLWWEQRFQIIMGTAEGLAYLHGGTKTRIIHRDIKSSNILLDENMTAKIADFGLARCFSADKTHLSTGIAGTLGYMAPEYLVRGQLTEKADVYSYGVLVLEIVCGRKNSIYTQESSSVLQTVWKHFKSNTLPESVDQSLNGNFPSKEATDVLQVGLLCTQASVTLRPSMSEVVQMLADKECTIPLPMQPPFLNASVVDPDTSPRSTSDRTSTGPLTSVVDPDNSQKSSVSNVTSNGLGSSASERR